MSVQVSACSQKYRARNMSLKLRSIRTFSCLLPADGRTEATTDPQHQVPAAVTDKTNVQTSPLRICLRAARFPDLPLIIHFFPSRAECSLKHSSSVDDIKSDQRYWQKRLQLRHSCTGENTPMFTSCCSLRMCSCTSPRTTPAQSSH